jgi:D-psicose/D-tagatose/L-ribulose 3-epimerase
MNPIGANLWIWDSPVTAEVIRERAPLVASMGFDLIEIPLEQPDDWTPERIDAALKDSGLIAGVCAVMAPGRDLTSEDPAIIESTQGYLRSCIGAAAGIGAAVVAGPIYSPTGTTGALSAEARAERIERIAHNLLPLADEARDAGVRLAIEPLNRFETSLFNTVAQTMELVDRLDHPAVGLLLDTFHMNIEERDMPGAIRAAGSSLVHFHACGNDRGAPSDDGIDWLGIRDALGEIGYEGALSIESFTSANRTIATAASIWRPLAPSQDDLARNGLAFLHSLFRTAG